MEAAINPVMSTYARLPVAFTHGEGCRLWDEEGRTYLDMLSGIGVTSLGHAPPKVVAAVREQVGRLIHTSNLYRISLQEQLAARLTATCFADQVFFCNSGAEANEAAIKLCRRAMKERGQSRRFEIITAFQSFHGRTLATLTATGQEKVQKGYEPLPPGFCHVPYNNIPAMARAIGPQTAAILVEPIQGETGVQIPDDTYLPALRELADQHGLLLVFDEVQTGMGRTGRLWCHQYSGVEPDIMTSAKAMASGLPMGALLARREVASVFTAGAHGSTFGGNPLVCSAALATLSVLLDDGLLESVAGRGAYLLDRLQWLMARHEMVKTVRGKGLMVAMELNGPAEEVAAIALARGLLINCTMGTILRLLPPLIVTQAEIDEAVGCLDGILTDLF